MVTGIVIAKNESTNIGKCLGSLNFCDKLLVVDNNSTDDTAAIAKKLGAEVVKNDLVEDFSALRNYALERATTPWVLFIDADEVVSEALAKEISDAVSKIEYKGFLIKRADFLWGRKLKYGDLWGVKLLRLGRRGAGKFKGKVHERWDIEGRVGVLTNTLDHYPHTDLTEFLRHINQYSTIKAQEFYSQSKKIGLIEIVLGPFYRFIQLYFGKLGFLDGTVGFIHAMTMSFYVFLVAGKLYLRHKSISNE